jgi:ubiquinone/menaquinone biosynthesis C-methylase UbiE
VIHWIGAGRSDFEVWLDGLGARFLREVGLVEGQQVLDFGCGEGAYALPAAQVVGPTGTVVALDKSAAALRQARRRAEERGLENIVFTHTAGGAETGLEDASIDVVLLYDVIHSWYFPRGRQGLLREVRRVCTAEALVSVYPSHMDVEEARRALEGAGFDLRRRQVTTLLHNGRLVRDTVLHFGVGS